MYKLYYFIDEQRDGPREATKERRSLPAGVVLAFREIEVTQQNDDVWARGLAHKREQGWGRRTILVGHAMHRGTTYRMAWEVLSASSVIIWAYGPHEGFYKKLARRARQ